jgi:hypothetical protein
VAGIQSDLNAEQCIRQDALAKAIKLHLNVPEDIPKTSDVVNMADAFATFVKDGTPIFDPITTTTTTTVTTEESTHGVQN